MSTPVTPKGGIYVIRLSPTHYYGGRTVCFRGRWRGHLRALEAGTHENRRMQAVYDIHKQFEPEVVIPRTEGLDLKEAEQRWLDENYGKTGCVNLIPTSDGGGEKWSDAMREKRRLLVENNPGLRARLKEVLNAARPAAMKAWRESGAAEKLAEVARRNAEAQRGVPQKPEVVARRVASNRGQKRTEETKQLMSRSAKARAAAHPTAHGEDTRKLISTQQKGRVWVHNETVNRRVWPEEARELIAQGWLPNRLPNRK